MRKEILFACIAAALCICVFVLDLIFPRGYIEWLLYIFPLLVTYRAQRSSVSYAVLALIGVLMVLGYVVSPDIGVDPVVTVVNRAEGFLTFLIFTFFIVRLQYAGKQLRAANEESRKKAAELLESNKELESFSYSVSHDLRAPLHSLRGFAQLLREDYREKIDQAGQDYLDRIDSSARKMNDLIDDLLRLSRLTRQQMTMAVVSPTEIVSQIINELRSDNPQRVVSTIVHPVPTAHADPQLLRIALDNLVRNAWKYTEKTENPSIEFGSTTMEGIAVYYVRDNGAGFDIKFAGKLFAPFQRLHSEKEFRGTGIGLAIVDRIMRRHGGRVWAEGAVGKGATFYFTLPQPPSE